jgi:nitrite reductase/ring-hydroxylating ferredoxin subunit
MPDKITRRDFIKRTALGIVVGGTFISNLEIDKIFGKTKLLRFPGYSDDIIVKLSDPQNSSLSQVNGYINLDDEDVLVRLSQTKFLAVNLICRHKGCTVDVTDNKFVCPCHGSEYDLDGTVTNGPAKANLITYETNYDPDKGIVTVKMKSSDNGKEKIDSTKIKKEN